MRANTRPLIGISRLCQRLQGAAEAFKAVIDAMTIADMATNRDQLFVRIEAAEHRAASDEGTTQ